MKRSLTLILLFQLVFYISNAGQISIDSIFNAGNQAYIEKKYNDAVTNYETLIKRGFRSAELFYNTGNAYFKTGEYAKAILFYERATLIDPGNSDIEFNLTKARTYVIDKIEIIPDFFVVTWFKSSVLRLSPNIWAIISITIFVVFMLLSLLYLLAAKAGIKRVSFYSGIIALIISVTTLFFSFKTKHYLEKSKSAIVMSPTVTVKSSPDIESADTFIIHEGTKVYILRSLNSWSEIKLSDGKQGWLESKTIEKI